MHSSVQVYSYPYASRAGVRSSAAHSATRSQEVSSEVDISDEEVVEIDHHGQDM